MSFDNLEGIFMKASEEITMPKVYNLNNVPNEFIATFPGNVKTMYLGAASGSEKLYANLDRIPPGLKSAKYHSHTKQEEFFLIMRGKGTLRLNNKEIQVQQGDFVAKPAGKLIAHQFINTGEDVLEILDVGLQTRGDIAYYPDEDVYLIHDAKIVVKGGSNLPNWDSEPNR
jgi:uncharacterized cupin superfamily protein